MANYFVNHTSDLIKPNIIIIVTDALSRSRLFNQPLQENLMVTGYVPSLSPFIDANNFGQSS